MPKFNGPRINDSTQVANQNLMGESPFAWPKTAMILFISPEIKMCEDWGWSSDESDVLGVLKSCSSTRQAILWYSVSLTEEISSNACSVVMGLGKKEEEDNKELKYQCLDKMLEMRARCTCSSGVKHPERC